MILLVGGIKYLKYTVKPVYKGHSWESENVAFIYRLKLYAHQFHSLMGKMTLLFIDSYLLFRGAL